jgi:hypothetical protein
MIDREIACERSQRVTRVGRVPSVELSEQDGAKRHGASYWPLQLGFKPARAQTGANPTDRVS